MGCGEGVAMAADYGCSARGGACCVCARCGVADLIERFGDGGCDRDGRYVWGIGRTMVGA